MVTPDYWGDLQVTTEQLTPAQIIQEQASALNERTSPHIRASVTTFGLERRFHTTLAVTVPSLNRYHLDIVTVIYPLRDYYPLVLSDDLGDPDDERSDMICNSEQEFRDELHQILSSNRTTDTLKSLLLLTVEEVLSL
ncbi:MAG: hypothetical protein J4F29_04695 [Candidatus Latescibacteria bacterium]|nr:hypothetical protein [Candidatus Latescibacterota bacterium]